MKLTARQLATTWFEALIESKPNKWSAISQRLLHYLYARGELRRLPEIIRLIEQLEHHRNRTVAVTVRTAHTLPDQLVHRAVVTVLPSIQPIIDQQAAPAVIGGLQIETIDQRFDLSVRGGLRQLSQTLLH